MMLVVVGLAKLSVMAAAAGNSESTVIVTPVASTISTGRGLVAETALSVSAASSHMIAVPVIVVSVSASVY